MLESKNEVVIVTYNRLELLKECIAAVLKQTVSFYKIIVVNNCSNDGTKEYLEQFENDETFHIIHEQENLGGAGGFYDGMSVALTDVPDWLLIIDDDAIIESNYVEKMLEYAGKHGDHAALAGSVITDGKIDKSHRRRVSNKLLFIETPVPLDEYKLRAFPCDTATFCGLMINGKAFQQVGLPKREYFLWYDDTEYSLRLGEFQARRFPELEEHLAEYREEMRRLNQVGNEVSEIVRVPKLKARLGKGNSGIMVIPEAHLNHKTKLAEEGKSILDRTDWRMYYGYRNRLDTAKNHFGNFSVLGIRMEYCVFFIISVVQLFIPSKSKHALFNIKLLRRATHDGSLGKLGKNKHYLPEKFAK
ncbi:MAG: glycosyltransferase [Lachnospiraceae bacterium]|nr:glycosyltransferase [Lachnospiraceae bacterium]